MRKFPKRRLSPSPPNPRTGRPPDHPGRASVAPGETFADCLQLRYNSMTQVPLICIRLKSFWMRELLTKNEEGSSVRAIFRNWIIFNAGRINITGRTAVFGVTRGQVTRHVMAAAARNLRWDAEKTPVIKSFLPIYGDLRKKRKFAWDGSFKSVTFGSSRVRSPPSPVLSNVLWLSSRDDYCLSVDPYVIRYFILQLVPVPGSDPKATLLSVPRGRKALSALQLSALDIHIFSLYAPELSSMSFTYKFMFICDLRKINFRV